MALHQRQISKAQFVAEIRESLKNPDHLDPDGECLFHLEGLLLPCRIVELGGVAHLYVEHPGNTFQRASSYYRLTRLEDVLNFHSCPKRTGNLLVDLLENVSAQITVGGANGTV